MDFFGRSERRRVTQRLAATVAEEITQLFPGRISLTRLFRRRRAVLQLDNGVLVSILVCKRREAANDEFAWLAHPVAAEASFLTLVCFANKRGTGVVRYYVIPELMRRGHRLVMRQTGKIVKTGVRLTSLEDLYEVATCIAQARNRPSDTRSSVHQNVDRGPAVFAPEPDGRNQ
jgi:hypothetical protein